MGWQDPAGRPTSPRTREVRYHPMHGWLVGTPAQQYKTVANRDVGDFGWEIAHAAGTRRPPISISTIVARTEGYTHAAKVWDLSIVQGPFSVAPCQTLTLRFATFSTLGRVMGVGEAVAGRGVGVGLAHTP
jgi:hypothetical protein